MDELTQEGRDELKKTGRVSDRDAMGTAARELSAPESSEVHDARRALEVAETKAESQRFIGMCRRTVKSIAREVKGIVLDGRAAHDPREAIENVTLAYRHLEDASMRLGKALQAIDGGVSVYDRESTVGA